MPNFFSNRLWWINSKSLSKVKVTSSGNRFLIRAIARSTASIDTGHIFSKKGVLAFRSVQTKRSPSPVFPDAIKSPSASPIRFLSLIYLGLLSIIRRSLIRKWLFFLPRFLGYILFRWFSILLPYILLIYVRMVTPDTYGRFLWYLRMRCDMCSGDWSSYKYRSIVLFSSECSTIVLGRIRSYFFLTLLLCWAYLALYLLPVLVFSDNSYDMALWVTPIRSAISFWTYPFLTRRCISSRSILPSRFCFFFS